MKNAKFMTIDLANFYLITLMENYEYLCIKLIDNLYEAIEEYNLYSIKSKG